MWDETNFLLKGFINEVKGALTESSGESGDAINFECKAGSILYTGVAVSTLNLAKSAFTSSAKQAEA